MTEKSHDAVVSCIGAVVGAAVAYMLFTERGRRLRMRLEPAIDDVARELNHFRGTVTKAAVVAGEGWKLLNDALAEPAAPTGHYADPHQTSPF